MIAGNLLKWLIIALLTCPVFGEESLPVFSAMKKIEFI